MKDMTYAEYHERSRHWMDKKFAEMTRGERVKFVLTVIVGIGCLLTCSVVPVGW